MVQRKLMSLHKTLTQIFQVCSNPLLFETSSASTAHFMDKDTGMVTFINWNKNVINFPMDTDVKFVDIHSQNVPITTAHDIVTEPLSIISESKVDNDVVETYGFEMNIETLYIAKPSTLLPRHSQAMRDMSEGTQYTGVTYLIQPFLVP